jgi:hypothetical protein
MISDDIIMPYYDTIMARDWPLPNAVKRVRVERGWSQEELARPARINTYRGMTQVNSVKRSGLIDGA